MMPVLFAKAGMQQANKNILGQMDKGVAKPAPPKLQPTGLEREQEFLKKFRDLRGTEAYPQYATVNMPDGPRKVLVYELKNGKKFIPQLHGNSGPDSPFHDMSLLDSIPTFSDVAMGRYSLPGPEAMTKGDTSWPEQNEVRPMLTEPLQTSMVQPSLGAALAGGVVNNIQPGTTPQPPPPPPEPPAPPTLEEKLDKLLQGQGTVDPAWEIAADKRKEAAGMAREVVRPNLTLQSALPLILTALLSGENGGDVLRGGMKGIEAGTQQRQAQSDFDLAAKRDSLVAEAAGIETEASKKEKGLDDQIRGTASMINMRDVKADRQAKNENSRLRITATMRGQDMTQMNKLASLGPEGRFIAAKKMEMSDEDALALAKMTPKEIQSLASAENSTESAKDKRIIRPYKQELLQSQTDLNRSLGILNDARKDGQSIRNQLDTKELEGWDDMRAAKLRGIEATTSKALADAEATRNKLFYSDGSVNPSSVKGMTTSTYTSNWSKFQSAFDAADAEIVEKQALVNSLTSKVQGLRVKQQQRQQANKMFPNDPVVDKALDKAEEALENTQAEIMGLQKAKESASMNMQTLMNLPGGGIGRTGGAPTPRGGQFTPIAAPANATAKTKGVLDAYNDRADFEKRPAVQQKAIVDFLRSKGLIK